MRLSHWRFVFTTFSASFLWFHDNCIFLVDITSYRTLNENEKHSLINHIYDLWGRPIHLVTKSDGELHEMIIPVPVEKTEEKEDSIIIT